MSAISTIFFSNTKELKYRKIINTIKHFYINDDRPFACGYSGGKDSSVAIDLVVKALMEIENPTKPVFIQFSDTLMEMDNTISTVSDSLDRLKAFAKENSLPIIIRKVNPVVEETFFSLLIGKGYQLPSEQRWCTDRLKIRPQNRLVKELQAGFKNGMITVVGSRKDESTERAERLNISTIKGIYKSHDFAKWNMLTPVEDLTANDIWNYIYKYSSEWIDSEKLAEVYEDASDDGEECRTILEGESGENAGCGKSARYGCWICPKVYSKDKALNNLGKKYSHMRKMEIFRNWLIKEGTGWGNRRNYRTDNQGKKIYNRGNHRDGMVVPSGYTLEFRQKILKKLWVLNEEIKEERGSDLISLDELTYIQNLWLQEGDIDLTVEKIIGFKLEGINTRLYKLAKIITKALERKPEENSIEWFPTSYESFPFIQESVSPRFVATLVFELINKGKTDEEIYDFIDDLMCNDYFDQKRNAAHKEYLSMKIHTKKFFPSKVEEEIIKQEWDNDEISFVKYVDNKVYNKVVKPDDIPFSLDGDYAKRYKKATEEYKPFAKLQEQYEELLDRGDIIDCETISLADKMAWFD